VKTPMASSEEDMRFRADAGLHKARSLVPHAAPVLNAIAGRRHVRHIL